MKQSSIQSFFKRSATSSTTDDLLRPAFKKSRVSHSPSSSSSSSSSLSSSTTNGKHSPNNGDDDDIVDSPVKKTIPLSTSKTNGKQVTSIVDEDDIVATPPIPDSPPSPPHDDKDDGNHSGDDTEEDEDAQQLKSTITRRTQSMPASALKAALRKSGNDDSSDEKDDDSGDESVQLKSNRNGNGNGVKANNAPKVDRSRSKLIMEQPMGNQVIQIRQGDITEECTGAIVNAANSSLAHGGGVAGAISRKGGPQIQSESTKWVRTHGPVSSGKVAVTGPGKLPCETVIHAVGPIWAGGKRGEDKELYGAVWNSLVKAHQLNLPSISIPAISSGIFGFPKDRCAYIMTECAVKFCAKYSESPLKQIRFTNFDNETVGIFKDEFRNRFQENDNNDASDNDNTDNTNANNSDDEDTHNTTTTKFSNQKHNSTKSHNTSKSSDKGDDTEEDESMQPTKTDNDSDSDDETSNTNTTTSTSKPFLKYSASDDDSGDDVAWGKWKR